MPPAFVHRITKYDPADRDEHGSYQGPEEAVSDHGPVEAAYLEAISAFAEAAGIDRLEIREPSVAGRVHLGAQPAVEGHGLGGLFPADLAGYHDGAEVSLAVALELIRVMLREQGAWCRLETGDVFAVHVGWDQYVYVSSDQPCTDAVARTRELGLFAEPLAASPYAAEPEVKEAAYEGFWASVRTELAARRGLLLEETVIVNATRWHRLTTENLNSVRAGLGPRALLTVWPDLQLDVGAVLTSLPSEWHIEFVWEAKDGTIRNVVVDETEYQELAALVADARAARALPLYADERSPLLQAVLPDSDGVLRARW
ncbi:RNA-binding protein [Streptomyces albogriseolus]|uniref:RNA-binding protein n=1 Tax=Streptomyces albogriseolus TaxID=1887 RepID=UPI002254865A|nr:RNA-binding protein [Streptomyces viridodiastaticus]MCX4564780.1 RNA-binding protein [Streptomyces viridodiastaticus]